MPVGGIRISREAGTTVRTASYLPIDCAVFCRFLSSRKVLPLPRLCHPVMHFLSWLVNPC